MPFTEVSTGLPSTHSVLPAVSELLDKAIQKGVTAAIVESPTFDELAGYIIDEISLPPSLFQHVQMVRAARVLAEIPLPVQEQRNFLCCNALHYQSSLCRSKPVVLKSILL